MPNIRKRTTARPKARLKPWVPTVVASQMPWSRVSRMEQRRRYQQFLDIVFRTGHIERIILSEDEELLLQRVAKKLNIPSTGGRIGKLGLIAPHERAVVVDVYNQLERFGITLPDIGIKKKR